jgi:outer membrane protein TolC
MEYDINQNIKETENRINFFISRFPQEITRDRTAVLSIVPASIYAGIPQLLTNRPDIKQAELELAASINRCESS